MSLWLLWACAGSPDTGPGAGVDGGTVDGGTLDGGTVDGGATDGGGGTDDGGADWPLSWGDDPCKGWSVATSPYGDTVQTWTEQGPHPAGQLVVVGSSSIRRWEGAFRSLAPWGVVQRGFGGARMWEVAGYAPELISPHAPAGVLFFAGTNDIADGSSVDAVVLAWRCAVERVWQDLGAVPTWFIGITPTPLRWKQWETSKAVNEAVQALSADHPGLHYIDVPAAFLATGSPPETSLFVEDQLHLSEAGYALWTEVVTAALAGQPARAVATSGGLPAGERVLIDLGPSNAEDGTRTTGVVDGLVWNAWHEVEGEAQILPGERLAPLFTTTGADSGLALVVTGGFRSNGLQNGGLQDPDPALLGDLAVPSATQDYFYTTGPDDPGGLALTGLDPARRYTLRLLASREWADETRVTRFTAHGGEGALSGTVTTSGRGIGHDGGDGNDSVVLELPAILPDAWGQVHLDVEIEAGSYGYVNVVEVVGL